MARKLLIGRRSALALIAGVMLVSGAGTALADGTTATGNALHWPGRGLPKA